MVCPEIRCTRRRIGSTPLDRGKEGLVGVAVSNDLVSQDLKDLMRQAGAEVTYADAHKDKRNEGFVFSA